MTELNITGSAWRFGTDIDTDVIVPSQYMRFDAEKYSQHIMEPINPDFAAAISDGDVIVAERNFGIGSSREHAAIGLKRAGIGAVVARSFGRIFYRNAINQGLAVLEADENTVTAINQGDDLEIDVFDGVIHNHTKDETYSVEAPDGLISDILAAGGAKKYYSD